MSGPGNDTGGQRGGIYKNISVSGDSRTHLGDVHYNGSYADPDVQCLKDLWPTNPEYDKDRIQQSKGRLLKDSYIWILENPDFQQWCDNQQTRILWIKGDPGKGKTMLLCGIIDELKQSTREDLLCFFFCQATDSRTNNAVGVLRGLIRQLVVQQPLLMAHVRKEYDNQGKEAFEDINAWFVLSRIFTSILEDEILESASLIIDALDECTMNDQTLLLDLIIQVSAIHSSVKWIVSSRNLPSIEDYLNLTTQKVRLSLELNEKSISTAVSIYIQHRVGELAKLKNYDENTRDTIHYYLSSHANNTFLWVALVCQELASPKVRPHHTLQKLYAFPSGLDPFYKRMMDQIRDSEDTELCNRILAITSIVHRPITLDELTSFIGMPNLESLMEIIKLCGSFLTVQEYTILFIHQSVKDFLIGKASEEIFPLGIENEHYFIFSQSLDAMFRTLRRDIYTLKTPGFPIDKVQKPEPDPLAAVKYSCIHWVDHLLDGHSTQPSGRDFQEGGTIDRFLRGKFLYWLEALSLLRGISEGALAILRLEGLAQSYIGDPQLVDFIRDARRFVLYFKWPLENCPLQVYNSALVFSPADSIIKQIFVQEQQEQSSWITAKQIIQDHWSACLQTLEDHSDRINSVIFSHDSKLLASACGDGTVRIFDTTTGKYLPIFEDYHRSFNSTQGSIRSIIFSDDSKLLVSTSDDSIARIWNLSTGKCLEILKACYRNQVGPPTISHDFKLLAWTYGDHTTRIWDTSTGECLQVLEGDINYGNPPASFSHDSKFFALASGSIIIIWDTNTKSLQALKGHSARINLVIFSYDSRLLASASEDGIVRIWDIDTGKYLQTHKNHNPQLENLPDRWAIFSHDSKLLASASYDYTIRLWDTNTGKCLQILEGHNKNINILIFSHDSKLLASASYDCTIRLWDTNTGKCLQILEGHINWINSITFSHDSKLLASASVDRTVRIWDTSKCLQILDGRIGSVNALASSKPESHRRAVTTVTFSADSKVIKSESTDCTGRIWDTNSGKCLHIFEGHDCWVERFILSRDSKLLASASYKAVSHPVSIDGTVMIWDANNGKCLQTLVGHIDEVNSIVFSHDSKFLASASKDGTIRIWDIYIGKCLRIFENYNKLIRSTRRPNGSMVFSNDSKLLASVFKDRIIRVWNINLNTCLQTLEGNGALIGSITFSHDSKLLASASYDGTIRIWDISTRKCLHTKKTRGLPHIMSFDIAKSSLDTGIGTINIPLALDVVPTTAAHGFLQTPGFDVYIDGAWITCNSKNILWLPPEYRPADFSVTETALCIGCESGRVLIFKIDREHLRSVIR